MADNTVLNAGSGGDTIATDSLTYSGDTAKVQLVRLVHVTGAEGSKTLSEILFAEDAAHTTGDYGLQALTVRKDTPAALAGADGDYQPLITDANGRLHVLDANSAAIKTAVELIDNAVSGTGFNISQLNGVNVSMGNGVSGTGVQRVTLASDSTGIVSLTTSTASIGKLAANSGVDIGDVDVLSLPSATNAGATVKTADFDTGVGTDTVTMFGLALPKSGGAVAGGTSTDPVRVDPTGTTTQPVSGTVTANLAAGTNNIGDVDVLTLPSLPTGSNVIGAVTQSGTWNITTVTTLTDITNWGNVVDNAPFTDGTTRILMTGFIFDDLAGTALTENDAAAARINANRAVVSTIEDGVTRARYATVTASNALKVDASGVTLTVGSHAVTNVGTFAVQVDAALPAGANAIGKLAANSGVDIGDVDVTSVTPGTGASNLGKAEDAVHATADVGVMVLAVQKVSPANLAGLDGDYEPLQVSAGRLWCSATIDAALPTGSNVIGAVTQSGTWNVGTVTTVTTVTTVSTLTTCSTVTTLTGSGVADDAADSGNPHKVGAVARTTNRTAVADGDRVNLAADDIGRLVTVTGQVRDLMTHTTTTISASTAETTVLAAGAAGVFHDLVCVIVANTSGTAARIDFRDATAGTIRFSIYAPAGQTVGFVPARPVTQATTAANWTAQSSASVTDLRVFVQAEKNV